MSIDRGALASIITGSPTPDYVLRIATKGFGVTRADLLSATLSHPLVHYRQVVAVALHDVAHLPWPEVGRRLNRDRSTVTYAATKVRRDPRLSAALETLAYEVRRQWALDHGQPPPPMPNQLSLLTD